MTITKPMLAGTVKDMKKIQYPVLCTRKLDGIRCLKINGVAVSRNFKLIPNKDIRNLIESFCPDGVDGEIIVEGGSFQETTSFVMSESACWDKPVHYHIFDYVSDNLSTPYQERINQLRRLKFNSSSGMVLSRAIQRLVLPVEIKDEQELLAFEKKCLADGYEGVMIRSPEGPYKEGRSTVREGYLLKLKRFADDEATIVGFDERMHNANEAKKDKFGRTERSSHKANMVPMGVLGAFRVKSTKFKKEFSIGTGLDDAQRDVFWKNRKLLMGTLVKYKYQPTGVKNVPRFPVFLGLRHENDL